MIFYENVFIAANRKAPGAQAKKIDSPAIELGGRRVCDNIIKRVEINELEKAKCKCCHWNFQSLAERSPHVGIMRGLPRWMPGRL